jgi:hypothetical protein
MPHGTLVGMQRRGLRLLISFSLMLFADLPLVILRGPRGIPWQANLACLLGAPLICVGQDVSRPSLAVLLPWVCIGLVAWYAERPALRALLCILLGAWTACAAWVTCQALMIKLALDFYG